MANPLTGDFDAVLQVSGNTVNRLLASLHQNASTKPLLPSFPHSMRLHLGDPYPVDGVRGRLHAQVGVPRITLVHGATDHFLLEVGVRGLFRADHGSSAFPAFIHGTVRAEYRLRDIDPNCLGWKGRASNYLWIRVVPESVRFEGTAVDDANLAIIDIGLGDGTATAAANVAKVTRQIAALLATRFEATPHPVEPEFRKGGMISLNVPGSGSAVALPIPLGRPPVGTVASIQQVLLGGSDLAVGIDVKAILALAEPALDSVRSLTVTVHVHVSTPWPLPDVDTVYHAGMNSPTIGWSAQGSHAVLKIKASGWARTNSILADATFDIEQDIVLSFDSGTGRLWLSEGSHLVKVHAGGIGHGIISEEVKKAVVGRLKSIVTAACAQAQPGLDGMTTGAGNLTQLLQTLDDQAVASIDGAEFLPDGLVLRGAIALSPRQAPVVITEKTLEEDAHSALQSWIPGGRIDKFEWTWTWAGTQATGGAVHDDRFVLRRPRGRPGRWGLQLGVRDPLPGLDGWGHVCLIIHGVSVDVATGDLVPVRSVRRCTRFGFSLVIEVEANRRLYLRELPELSQDAPFPQLSVRNAGGRHQAGPGTNTLLVYGSERWDQETALALRQGLERSGRFDAGLQLLVLFREGALATTASPLIRDIHAFAADAGIAVHVNEDVGGSWSRVLEFNAGDLAWRLFEPNGVVAWSHDGRLGADAVASALGRKLATATGPAFGSPSPRFGVGSRVVDTALHVFEREIVQSTCPPFPFARASTGSVITFVKRASAASATQLRQLAARYREGGDEAPTVVLVVDGADAREVEEMKNELGVDFLALADPAGTVTDRFDVRTWPTTLTVDRGGLITEVQVGVESQRTDR